MKTPKRTEKSNKKSTTSGANKLSKKPVGQKTKSRFIDDDDDEFNEPLDDISGFDALNDYDDDDDY